MLNLQHIKGDLFGGITAGIVALPLALAFGVQSGMGAVAGLYGAIILGMFAAVFGGTSTQVSGPTGPMTVVSAMVIASAIEISGSLQNGMGIIITSFILAGVFQIIFGLTKIGRYIKYIPYPVVSGFMTGIGFIIIIYQIHPFLGYSSPSSTAEVFLNIFDSLLNLNMQSAILGGLTMLIIYLFPKISKAVPSTLVALIVMTIISSLFALQVPVIGDIPSGIPSLKLESLFQVPLNMAWTVLEFAITLAALGAIDSLLTSVIADNITKTKHNSNQELIGQGIGNTVAALFGGLPGAGATMRTVVNIKSGGKTPLSGFVHALILLAILLGLGKYAAYIPLSVLSGILITVGIGIIDYKGLKHIKSIPKEDAAILLAVLLITIFGNLLHAVGVGTILACVLFMKQVSDFVESSATIKKIKDEKDDSTAYAHGVYIKKLYGPLFFGAVSKFEDLCKELANNMKVLIIHMENVPSMDQSGLYAMEEVINYLREKNVVVVFVGLQPQPADILKKINVIPNIVEENHVFSNFSDCEIWLKSSR